MVIRWPFFFPSLLSSLLFSVKFLIRHDCLCRWVKPRYKSPLPPLHRAPILYFSNNFSGRLTPVAPTNIPREMSLVISYPA
ncbi:hypothetical protein B9Z19DRAFT_1090926 [Tuber borchii]|uniref:Secreted protein n=1 Tax=Tuber borchii TaxID=42251 RepID=A0A2T6ZI71_TUBBO|nr:hypothetical protein B9Z19DRAFT_1090926 [Tuber borchii]